MRWLLNIGNKHPALERLSEYLDGRLAGRALQRVEAHLSACAACRQEVESLRATVALLRRAPQPAQRRSFVLMQPPVSAPAAERPRRALAPTWAFSAAATVLVAVFVTVLSLDVGGALSPASPVPVPSAVPLPSATSKVPEAPASTPTPVPAPLPTSEAREAQASTPTPAPSTPTSVPGGFGIAAVPGPTPSPAPPQLTAAPQPTPAPDGGLLAGASEKAAGDTVATKDASQIPANAPALPTRVLSEEPMAPGRTYSQESILSGGAATATDTATPMAAPGPAAASPEATTVQAVVQGPTHWGWRVAEGLLAAGVLLLAGLGLRLWGRARRAAR